MSKLLLFSALAASVAFAAARPAFAVGGMGDPSRHMKEMNALCDLQRRGEAPPSPNVCLPEYPPGPVEQPQGRGYHGY